MKEIERSKDFGESQGKQFINLSIHLISLASAFKGMFKLISFSSLHVLSFLFIFPIFYRVENGMSIKSLSSVWLDIRLCVSNNIPMKNFVLSFQINTSIAGKSKRLPYTCSTVTRRHFQSTTTFN